MAPTSSWPFWPLFDPCDLDLQPTWKNVSNDTSPPWGQQLCKIILKSMLKCTSYAPDKLNTCIWPFWPIFDPCDLDLQPTYKNVSNGTTSTQRQKLCQIVLKSMHYCTSYGPDKSARMPGRTHIHWTKIVTTMSRLSESRLDKKLSCKV